MSIATDKAKLQNQILETMEQNAKLRRRLEAIAQLSTGWKHGEEGDHLLQINTLARGKVQQNAQAY